MSETTDQTTQRLADRSPVVAREIVCPDGIRYTVYTDGTWDENTWDGSFVRDSEDYFATMFAPGHRSDENRDALRQEVLAKLGL